MALSWQTPDLTDDDGEERFGGDPAAGFDLPDLEQLLQRPSWHRWAACRGKGTDAWFPTRGADLTSARDVCRNCPVTDHCLAAGLIQPSQCDVGVWGGTSARERRRLRSNAA